MWCGGGHEGGEQRAHPQGFVAAAAKIQRGLESDGCTLDWRAHLTAMFAAALLSALSLLPLGVSCRT